MTVGRDADFRTAVRVALVASTAPISMWQATEDKDVADWKKVVGAVAPALASALGGPLAGVAVKAIAGKLLGDENASEDEVAKSVADLPPDAIVKLKEAEQAFILALREADVKEEAIHQQDRASARLRETALKDFVPGGLAVLIVTGFGWTLHHLVTSTAAPPPDVRDVLYMMLGALASALAQVLAYYFGSSSGSKAKTDALERVAKS